MVDQISEAVCGGLNIDNPGWTWAAQMANQRNWSRIYRIEWTNHIQAGTLQSAVRAGHPILNESYPPIWFEFRCSEMNQPNGPFEICVPISTKGFRRSCRCAVYANFLQSLSHPSENHWPQMFAAVNQYINNPDEEYIAAHLSPINPEYAANVQAFINQHWLVINEAFDNLH